MELLYSILYLIVNGIICSCLNCDRIPEGAVGQKGDPDTKFRIVIDEEPTAYTPSTTYTVLLQATHYIKNDNPILFNGFTLTVNTVDLDEKNTTTKRIGHAGLFQPNQDHNAKLSENCPNMVVHQSRTYVPKVEVSWIAPPPGSGCVIFKAAVMEQNVWYMDDRGLTLEFCEETNVEEFETVDPCCACAEATYELKFEGLWTRQSHPNGFPQNHLYSIRFSDIIGVSSNVSYRFWKPNTIASQGLVDFCERDNSTLLESEIKNSGIRTVIKAKGLSYPHITGKTFAIFRVDPTHHLLSVISMIQPTPDWFIGISGLELCQSNCTFAKYREVFLYPFDLGIYDDEKFNSRNFRTSEHEPIFRIQPKQPDGKTSPFYDESRKGIHPLAKLSLTFQKQYDKECSDSGKTEESTITKDQEEIVTTECTKPKFVYCDCNSSKQFLYDPCTKDQIQISVCECREKKECETTDWGPWSNCTESDRSCAESVKVRFRKRRNPEVAKSCSIDDLQEYTTCNEVPISNECAKILSNRKCQMTSWSIFSTCDRKRNCTSERIRNRRENDEGAHIRACAKIALKQTVQCDLSDCLDDDSTRRRRKRR